MTNKTQKYSGLMGWLAACFLAGALAAQFDPGGWYDTLAKPSWTPPDWIFPVAWTILYLMMGIAAWLVWKDHGFTEARDALTLFLVQLGLNAAWPGIFFGLQQIGTALAEILLLWILILFTLFLFWKFNRRAGWLMLPYLIWVSYAAALNFAVWHMN